MTTSTKIKTQSLEEFGSSTFKMSYVRTTDPKVTATVWPAPDRTVTSSWGRVNVPLAVFTSRIIVNSAVCERTVWGHCEAPGTSVRRRGTVGEGLARTNQGQWSPAAAGRAGPRAPRQHQGQRIAQESVRPGTPRTGDPAPTLRLREGSRQGGGLRSGRREVTCPRRGGPALLCNPALRLSAPTSGGTRCARVPRGAGPGWARPRLCSARGASLPSRPSCLLGNEQPDGPWHCPRFSKEAWAPPSRPLPTSRSPRHVGAGTWEPPGMAAQQREDTLRDQLPQHGEGGLGT